jgi:hypothetical protein
MDWRAELVIAVFAVVCEVHSATAMPGIRLNQISKQETTCADTASVRRDSEEKKGSPLRIANVRIEAAPPVESRPSAVLKFRASNGSSNRISDIVFEIAIVERSERDDVESRSPRTLAGPFTIRGKVVLEPGYTADYEMLVPNLSRDCRCAAKIQVVSVRSVPEGGP